MNYADFHVDESLCAGFAGLFPDIADRTVAQPLHPEMELVCDARFTVLEGANIVADDRGRAEAKSFSTCGQTLFCSARLLRRAR